MKSWKARKTLLIVGEGYDEVAFLNHLKQFPGVCGQGVEITIRNARGKGAAGVVDCAIKLQANVAYDRVAVLLDTDTDWTAKRAPQSVGAMCFYGAPGTGKTALAHYIAREIGLPLIVRRASDILSPYVGETEQQIARMFKQAQHAGALLLLDEADSFLAERQSARNTWEVTGVNEMLTQMERFDGLFICSTNLMQRLDAASLRRFALKIKFDYLKPEQRWQLFRAQFKRLSTRHEADARAALNQLYTLTPGDFATVRRQAALFNVTLTADEWLQRLTQECRNKAGGVKQPIGFVHSP